MSTKIINNLKVHGENTTQKYTDAQYNTDTQRINGAQPGTPISSKLINTGLRNATLVTSALIEALKTVVPNDNDLTIPITVGTETTHAALVAALTEALVKIKVEHAILADNVKSGAIVEETTTAREAKQGYGISLNLNSKLQFKTSWVGTHKNNDVLYYSTAGALKGFYIVKGLSAETTTQQAGTLTISSGDTPITHAANLQRLTFETAISTNSDLSKTDTVSSTSTTNQLVTAKGVYDYAQAKLAKHTTAGIKILTRGTTDGTYSDLNKVTTMPVTPTNSQIPTAKLLKSYAQPIIPSGSPNDILVKSTTAGIVNSLTKVTSVSSTSTDMEIPTAKSVYNYTQPKITKYTTAGVKILSRATIDGALSDLDKVTSIGTIPTNTQIPSALAVKNYVDTKLGESLSNGTLIGTYTNNQAINKSMINGYKFLLFELKKQTTGYDGNFYGDSKIVTPDIFYHYYLAAKPKTWETSTYPYSGPFVIDEANFDLTTSSEFVSWLNSNKPASGYNTGDVARNTYNINSYVYAVVSESNPEITQNGGIRLAQFDGSLTYATVTSISTTQIRLKCDPSYNLRVWGFN